MFSRKVSRFNRGIVGKVDARVEKVIPSSSSQLALRLANDITHGNSAFWQKGGFTDESLVSREST